MNDKWVDDIEVRTRKVEEAIIGFSYIADVILVQHNLRLRELEKHDEELQTILYASSDVKSQEIDTKVSIAANSLRDTFEKYFKWSIAISSAMFFIFIGYITYDQGQKDAIGTAITARALDSRENKTNITTLFRYSDKIDSKFDQIINNQEELFANQRTIMVKGK